MLCSQVFRINNTIDIQVVDHLLKMDAVDLCYQLGLRIFSCQQGQHQILLIHIGQGDKRLRMCQPFLQQKLFIRSVPLKDRRVRELLTQHLAALFILLDDPYIHPHFQKLLGEIKSDHSAAYDQCTLHLMRRDSHFLEKLRRLSRNRHHRNQITIPKDEISVRDHNFSLFQSLHATDHNVTLHLGKNVGHFQSVHM